MSVEIKEETVSADASTSADQGKDTYLDGNHVYDAHVNLHTDNACVPLTFALLGGGVWTPPPAVFRG